MSTFIRCYSSLPGRNPALGLQFPPAPFSSACGSCKRVPRIIGHLVFPKRYTSTTRHLRYQHECAYVLAKGYPQEPAYPIGDVIEFSYSGNKLHPTEKPLSALLPLVETFSQPGGLVLDCFAGSGSSLHAAKALGRRYLGIEMDENYHNLAVARLRTV